MIESKWTYMGEDGSEAPPEDGDSGHSAPVVAWFPEGSCLLDGATGKIDCVVAMLDDDGYALAWASFNPEGYEMESWVPAPHPFCWIARPMDGEEFAKHADGKPGPHATR